MFSNIPYIFLIRFCFNYIGKYRYLYYIHISFAILANIMLLVQPYFFGKVLNVIQIGGDNMFENIIYYLLLMILSQILWWIFHHTARYNEIKSSLGTCLNYKNDIYKKLVDLPLEWHNNTNSGIIINQINKTSNAIQTFMRSHFRNINVIITGIGSIGVILYSFPLYGIISILLGLVVILNSVYFDLKIVKVYKTYLDKDNKLAGILHDYITNISTVIILKVSKLTQSELINKSELLKYPFNLNTKLSELKRFVNFFLSFCVKIIIIFLYCYFTLKSGGVLLAGTLAMIYQYLQNVENTFNQFNDLNSLLIGFKADIQNSQYIIDEYNKQGVVHTYQDNCTEKIETIELRNINYNYLNSNNFCINIDSFVMNKGQKIAFVGESGHGKTTFMKIIRGLYKPESGNLVLNGKEISLSYLMDNTMLIPQEPEIFENTIRYNITFGIESNKEEIQNAINSSCFNKVLQKLPNGLETHINEKGVNLSGGERQRLALARGIFVSNDSEIILMDEPTSSVDPVNERKIYENLMELYKDKILISSIHKFNLLDLFDYIYVFENGTIVEQGTFEELINIKGKFYSMYQKHSKTLETLTV